jgi:DNA-binding transcriptional ArsR family regulator
MDGHEAIAVMMKALGHPVRLLILEALLQEDEACVCHLEALLNRPQAYISQHLARLREAGLVIDRRDGMNVFYALADESIALLLDEARRTAESLAREGSVTIVFSEVPRADPTRCPCPKCREKAVESGAARESSTGI